MAKMKAQMQAKAEAILMGMTQYVESNEEAILLMDYICEVLDVDVRGEEIFAQATQYTQNAQIKAVCVSVLMGEFRVITLPMSTDEDTEPFNLLGDYCFSYVYNLDAPELSELGDCGFEQTPKGIKRIW